jgi:hypothetical protein
VSTTLRFFAERCRYAEEDVNADVEIWEPCLVEMSVDPSGRHLPVYDVDVKVLQPRAPGDELSTMRDRVGRIARRLEDVTSELRMLAEGLSPEESARTLERIEESLGIRKEG